jgi:hypothetical protein
MNVDREVPSNPGKKWVPNKKAYLKSLKNNTASSGPKKTLKTSDGTKIHGESTTPLKALKTDLVGGRVVSFDKGSKDASIMKSAASEQSRARSEVSTDSAQALFKKARQFINPSPLYRWIMYLYAERKLVVFFGIHFVSTMIIWGKLSYYASKSENKGYR